MPLDAFLFRDKAGYCQQFSGAMALLLRMGGVPARVAAGFTPGDARHRARREFVVRDFDAHSWVEAYFPGYGWVTFDPTPAIAPARAQDPGAVDDAARRPRRAAAGDAATRRRATARGDAAAPRRREAATTAAAPPVGLIVLGVLLRRRRWRASASWRPRAAPARRRSGPTPRWPSSSARCGAAGGSPRAA